MKQKSKLQQFFTEEGRPAAIALLTVVFGFYGTMAHMGLAGNALGALFGFIWAIIICLIAKPLLKRPSWQSVLANSTLIGVVICLGLMSGAGLMYIAMMSEVLKESTVTGPILSALMKPAVPFYITINSSFEMFLMPLLILANWKTMPRRKLLLFIALAIWLFVRIWTFLVYAEMRLDITQHTLLPADVEWFKQTLATDYRLWFELVAEVFLVAAATYPARLLKKSDK